MANISVRKLPEECIQLLRLQAAKHGVSMEEEVRQILFRDLYSAQPIGDLAVKLFKDAYAEDTLVIPPREVYQPVEFK